MKFSNAATAWGCQHENEALNTFSLKMKSQHTNFKIEQCGLFLNPEFPYLGASPDGLALCDCCECMLVEIKCPYCKRFEKLDSPDSKRYLLKSLVI